MSRLNRNNCVSTCVTTCFSIMFWSVAVFQVTDGGSITWFEPPPFATVTEPFIISAANKSLIKGSPNEELSCNFSLTADLRIITVSMKFGGRAAVTLVEKRQAPSVDPIFASRLNATWYLNKLTLILFNVTDAEEGEYRCEVISFGRSAQTWVRTIQVSLLVPPSITSVAGKTVIEGENVMLKCLAEGKPTPSITWTRLSDNRTVTMPLINISRGDVMDYRCTADNGVGTPATRNVTIDVQFAPENASLSTNLSSVPVVCAGMFVNFTCTVEGSNPTVDSFTLYANGRVISKKNLSGVWIETLDACGEVMYQCQANNFIGTSSSNKTLFFVEVPASVDIENDTIVVVEGRNVTLHCLPSGSPSPNVHWIDFSNEVVEEGRVLKFLNITRRNNGSYTCSASNACGSDTKKVDIVVEYPPEVNDKVQNATVAEGVEHSFSCPVGGNPVPNITWYSGTETYCAKLFKTQQSGCYICVARNIHGISDNITQCLIINSSLTTRTVPPSTDARETMLSSIAASQRQEIQVTVTIITNYEEAFEDLNSASSKEFVAKFEQEMDQVYTNVPEYIRTKVTQLRPGSVIVYFILYFKTAVTPEKGIENLRIAISFNGTLGDFQVKDLVLMSEESTKSTKTTGFSGPSPSSTTAPEAGPPWIIIIAVAGGVVLLAILVGVLTWRVRKQRKCRKDSKIHSSNLGRDDNERGYSQVHRAYAQSGPPAASGTDGAAGQEIEVAAAIPTYAVVDKSKKKKLREEVPAVYAEVDKSKKKKKKVDDKNLYETLDEPKKARKPGELLYADLGDFQNPGMSPVSISPQPLPAIKIPEPYERTDYADITQFHKGNAKLPQNDGNEDTEMKPKRPSKKKIQGNDNETPI